MNTNFHEKETIILKASKVWQRKQLHLFLRKRGFKSVDDFYELFRKGRYQSWQSSAIVTISVSHEGQDIYETEEDIKENLGTRWDELRCEYLLATLPRECVAELVREVEALTAEFALRVNYNGEEMDGHELSKRLNRVADYLTEQWDAPGSESLRILIQQQYQ